MKKTTKLLFDRKYVIINESAKYIHAGGGYYYNAWNSETPMFYKSVESALMVLKNCLKNSLRSYSLYYKYKKNGQPYHQADQAILHIKIFSEAQIVEVSFVIDDPIRPNLEEKVRSELNLLLIEHGTEGLP